MPIAPRQPAPPFTLGADDGTVISYVDLIGKPTVLYFYPYASKANPYAFVEQLPTLARLGVHAFAISNEPVPSSSANTIPPQQRLTDATGDVLAAYDAMGMHRIYNQLIPGILSSVVLIDADGKVVRRWPRVVFREHFEAVTDRVKRLVARAAPQPARAAPKPKRR